MDFPPRGDNWIEIGIPVDQGEMFKYRYYLNFHKQFTLNLLFNKYYVTGDIIGGTALHSLLYYEPNVYITLQITKEKYNELSNIKNINVFNDKMKSILTE